MREDHKQALVDLTVVGLGAVAAVYVWRTPSLRRMAWRLLKYGALTAAPQLVRQEVTRAWAASRRA